MTHRALSATEFDAAWQVASDASEVLGPEAGLFARADPADLGRSALSALARATARPAEAGAAWQRFWAAIARAGPAAIGRWRGSLAVSAAGSAGGADLADISGKRFADPSWAANPAYFALRQAYLATCRLAEDLLAAGRGDPVTDQKARLAVGFALDALAPTNFLLTNPAALKRALETGGASVVAGARNLLDDIAHNRGRPRQVDTRPFELGRNLAATPGRVVFRDELMELIQYTPRGKRVRAAPLLASPPWINKYYVADLAPGRSFLEWAIKHQRTVFAISSRDPDASMSGITLENYLVEGPSTALDVICDITGSPTVDVVGLCLGGALTAVLAAYLAAGGDDRIGSLTLLNTLLDYSEPGVPGGFAGAGANDLIFSYVVSSWLMGQPPPAFDLLAWNADSAPLPAAMHAFCLRSLYERNELARGELELAGRRLSLGDVKGDVYVAGAVNDHIAPWASAYRATGLLGGNVRYVLSSGGHIAGIVNPPSARAWYLADGNARAGAPAQYPADARQWRTGARRHPGSWWEDWAAWSGARAGRLVPPPPMGSDRFPVLGDAPGEYVRGIQRPAAARRRRPSRSGSSSK